MKNTFHVKKTNEGFNFISGSMFGISFSSVVRAANLLYMLIGESNDIIQNNSGKNNLHAETGESTAISPFRPGKRQTKLIAGVHTFCGGQ